MKTGKYNIKDLFVNRYLEQIIIPEIQRDYVWNEFHVLGLLNSIANDYNKLINYNKPILIDNDGELEEAFFDFHKRRNFSSNIGFIYAYCDSQYPGRYFLIDGQQRITTVFLVLLVLASRNNNLKNQFQRTFTLGDKIKLDYKVRESAHRFFAQLVPYLLKNKGKIERQHWYYKESGNDKTIHNVLNNCHVLSSFFDEKKMNEENFYNYLLEYCEFWYFDTNVSKQGEELYIYMNARGEQMQNYENIKAELLSNLTTTEDKNIYGKIWEDWQDFFWINKGKNENADIGFNEFLFCIAGLQQYLIEEQNFLNQSEFEKNQEVRLNYILKHLDLVIIKKHVESLKYLLDNKENFKSLYAYSAWVEKCIEEIWKILNDVKRTNWFANYNDANRGTERSKMVLLWSVLHFMAESDLDNADSISDIFRVLRLYYVRYNNYNRSVTSIKTTVNILKINGVIDPFDNIVSYTLGDEIDLNGFEPSVDNHIRTYEEQLKNITLNHYIGDEINQRELEGLIWKLEDHPLNLDGSGVGNINISHLVNLNFKITIEELEKIIEKFYLLFPLEEKNYLTIQNILLYYDVYWYRVSPYYYFNYEFDNWKKIIRDIREDVNKERTAFSNFWLEYQERDLNPIEFLNEFRKHAIDVVENSLAAKLMWYNHNLGDKMWAQGNHIAFSNGNYCGLPDWQNKDKVFSDNFIIYNIKGDLKGGNREELYNILPKEVKIYINNK